MSESSKNGPAAGLSTNRIEAFSDGVFAIAITLLVLNLQIPEVATINELGTKLGDQWPKFASYVLSFVIVGIYWVAHHNTFHYIKHSDRNLLWLNILMMMFIVFIPYPTALLGQYPEAHISFIIYGSTLVMIGLVLQLLWWYATSDHRLVDRNIDPQLVQRATRRNLTGPFIYLFAIGVSLLNIQACLILFMLVPVYYILPGRIDRYWVQRPTQKAHVAGSPFDKDVSKFGEEAVHPREISIEEH